MSPLVRTLTMISAVGAATAAGTFFTFSTFTIDGLRRLAPTQGAASMQSINRAAPTPLFMLLLFGTGLSCLVLAIGSATNLEAAHSRYQLVGCALYLLGVVLLTIAYHVPRNERLDAFDPDSAEGVAYWRTYLRQWVPMNHIRTITPIITATLLIISLQMD